MPARQSWQKPLGECRDCNRIQRLPLLPISICHRKNEMNFWFLTSVCLLLCVASTTDSLASEESAPNKKPAELELKTERVFVFKDGHCLIVKKGMAKTNKEGVAYTEDVPDAAVLGSFWAVPTEGTVESMTAGWVDEEEELTREETCTNVIEVIRANVGKECSFTLDEDRQMRGKIVKVLHPEYPSELPILSASDVGDPFQRCAGQPVHSSQHRSTVYRRGRSVRASIRGVLFPAVHRRWRRDGVS